MEYLIVHGLRAAKTWIDRLPWWLRQWSGCLQKTQGDPGLIPGWGRFPGEGNGNPLQYSCLENPRDGAWWATVHGVTKSRTQLSDFTSMLCQIESLNSLNHLTFIALGYKGSLICWTPFSHVNNFSSRLALPFFSHWYNLVHWLHELFCKMTTVS